MGRIRFKLSHVIPHAWFYKQKQVSTSGESLACTSSSLISKQLVSTSNKVSYTSPVNHKAIDIPFPAETPKKNPLADVSVEALAAYAYASFPEDIAILSPLDPVELSVDLWPFISISTNKSNLPLDNITMEEYAEIDLYHGFSSAPKGKLGSVNTDATFDAEELERRLKALATEDRRRYYASPMLTGVMPSPRYEGSHAGWGGHGNDEASKKKDFFRGTDIIRRSPVRVVAKEGKLFDGDGSGEGVYRSSNESNSLMQSTSSSDTGCERASSSVWERDIFSITSDGSEAFATGEDGGSSHINMQRTSRQPHKKPKEMLPSPQRSPLMYGNGRIDSSIYHEVTSGLYEDHHSGAENGNGRSSYKIRENSTVRSDIHMYANSSHDGRNDINRHDPDDINMHGHNNDIMAMTHNDTTIDDEWGGFNSSDYRSLSKASPTNSMSSLRGGRGNADMYHQELNRAGKLSPLWNHEQSFQLPLVQYEGSEPKSKRVSPNSDQFSYMGCKERLLSGRMSFEQSNDKAASEGEMEKLSNYDKFKLRQKNGASGKVNTAASFSPDVGLCKSMPNINKMPRNANLIPSYQSTPEHHTKGPSQRSPLYDYSTRSSPNRKGSYAGLNNTREQGPSWSSKATLKAVREKTGDPSFQRFSTNSPEDVRSRVFDSFAMVKCSYDPKQDFKESMVEMIFEKHLNSSYDMVELLQCYLTLNPPRYHDIIVKVFTEVWSEVFQDV